MYEIQTIAEIGAIGLVASGTEAILSLNGHENYKVVVTISAIGVSLMKVLPLINSLINEVSMLVVKCI